MEIKNASWIKSANDLPCVLFKKAFESTKTVKKATLDITCMGTYKAFVNGNTVGDFIMGPGFTSYKKRLQYQSYDVTAFLQRQNEISVSVGKGWCVGTLAWENNSKIYNDYIALLALISIEYEDGTKEAVATDGSWQACLGNVTFSEVYDGETYDANAVYNWEAAALCDLPKENIIPQEGEFVREKENIPAKQLIVTPKGECVIDFGQNLTGYVQFSICGKPGAVCTIEHAEVLDKNGNFYTTNLRNAKQKITFICDGKPHTYKPYHSFQGFRYIKLENWPEDIRLDNFTAIAVYSDMPRTGFIKSSHEKLNKLFENIIWGQKGNFLDIPTDCPQRDERLGWTGDAQVFCRTASYNFDVEKFFTKWLRDLKADQFDDGGVPAVIPNVLKTSGANSSAWGDAAVIVPWQMYLTYGNKDILAEQFQSMKKWVMYIKAQGDNPFLWNTGHQYGDWLGMDAPAGSYKGSTSEALIATAFFAYSTSLLIKAGKVLGENMSEFEELYGNVVAAYRKEFLPGGVLTSNTQTAHAITLYFGLCDDSCRKSIAANLAKLVTDNGNRLTTGFVGTPYLLHALSDNGYTELTYSLLLQERFPSWLFSVNMGATTIWEHWDGINENGDMWSAKMNSFNHYAYGAVADWIYGVAAGIRTDESAPGFKHVVISPNPDKRLGFLEASIDTRYGKVVSGWKYEGDTVKYRVEIPEGVTAEFVRGSERIALATGLNEL